MERILTKFSSSIYRQLLLDLCIKMINQNPCKCRKTENKQESTVQST